MKDLHLITWLTQLGMSVAVPLAGFVLLAVWLREELGWGIWVIWVGIVLGLVCAVDGLIRSLKILDRMGKKDKASEPPSVAFNDHD
jgi:hypothetical protein